MSRSHPSKSSTSDSRTAEVTPAETAAIFELLGDHTARSILRTLRVAPKTARELVAECDGSRPTIYRRLSRLEELGLIGSTIQFDTDGHHRKEFSTSIKSVVFDLSGEQFEAAILEASSPSV